MGETSWWRLPDGTLTQRWDAGRALAPELGAVRVAPPPRTELLRRRRLAQVRLARNERLASSDGPALRELERRLAGRPSALAAWMDYRDTLRELPPRVAAALAALETEDELERYDAPWPAMPDSVREA